MAGSTRETQQVVDQARQQTLELSELAGLVSDSSASLATRAGNTAEQMHQSELEAQQMLEATDSTAPPLPSVIKRLPVWMIQWRLWRELST